MEHLEPDQLVLLALGERPTSGGTSAEPPSAATDHYDRSVRAHLQECVACRHELSELARTVEIAREAGELGPQTPVVLPASIWSGIARELGIGTTAGQRPDPPAQRPDANARPARGLSDPIGDRSGGQVPPPSDRAAVSRRHGSGRRVSVRRGLLVAAVVVAIGVGVGVGVAIGGRDATVSAIVSSQAALTAMPAAPPTAHGTATITQTAEGLTLTVTARALPLRQGYYEVWLYNPTADQMVAVGTLGAGGDGIWSLASTIDLRSYSVVDVSAQDFDGNPAHKASVLQGPLTQ